MSDCPGYWLPFNLLNADKFAHKTESGTAGKGMKMVTISGEELSVLGKKNVVVNIGNFHSKEEFILLRMVEDCMDPMKTGIQFPPKT